MKNIVKILFILFLTASCNNSKTSKDEIKERQDLGQVIQNSVKKYINVCTEIFSYMGGRGGIYETSNVLLADNSKENYIELKVDSCSWLKKGKIDSSSVASYCAYKIFTAMNGIDKLKYQGIRINLRPDDFISEEDISKNLLLKKYFFLMDSLVKLNNVVSNIDRLVKAFIENKQNEILQFYDTAYIHTSWKHLEELDSAVKSVSDLPKIIIFRKDKIKTIKGHINEEYLETSYLYVNEQKGKIEHTINFYSQVKGENKIWDFLIE